VTAYENPKGTFGDKITFATSLAVESDRSCALFNVARPPVVDLEIAPATGRAGATFVARPRAEGRSKRGCVMEPKPNATLALAVAERAGSAAYAMELTKDITTYRGIGHWIDGRINGTALEAALAGIAAAFDDLGKAWPWRLTIYVGDAELADAIREALSERFREAAEYHEVGVVGIAHLEWPMANCERRARELAEGTAEEGDR
jgi:hypothetical protein